jgi:hypothetical protein
MVTRMKGTFFAKRVLKVLTVKNAEGPWRAALRMNASTNRIKPANAGDLRKR